MPQHPSDTRRDLLRDLTFYFGRTDRSPWREARRRLLTQVLDVDCGTEGSWHAFSLFVPDGACVANIDAGTLLMTLGGAETATIGLRSVAVDDAWRGRGLFRNLMTRCLAWCDSNGPGLTLLFTEDPDFYQGYGFRQVPQHAFVGPCPAPSRGRAALRQLDPALPDDRELIRSHVARRAPVSSQCALGIDPDQMLMNLTKEDAYAIGLIAEIDTLVVYAFEDDMLVLADIVSRDAPDLARIVGSVGRSSPRLKVLFPPDRLGWIGVPVAEETGLMIRGTLPPELRRPFMIAPTAEF